MAQRERGVYKRSRVVGRRHFILIALLTRKPRTAQRVWAASQGGRRGLPVERWHAHGGDAAGAAGSMSYRRAGGTTARHVTTLPIKLFVHVTVHRSNPIDLGSGATPCESWCHAGIRVACGHGCRGQQPNRRQLPEELASKHLSPPPCPTHHADGVPTHAGIVAVPCALGKNATLAASSMVWWFGLIAMGAKDSATVRTRHLRMGTLAAVARATPWTTTCSLRPPPTQLTILHNATQSRRRNSFSTRPHSDGRHRALWGMHYSTCPTQP
jgi:hypothetical protein